MNVRRITQYVVNVFIWADRPNYNVSRGVCTLCEMWSTKETHNYPFSSRCFVLCRSLQSQIQITPTEPTHKQICVLLHRNNYFNLKCKITSIIFIVATQQIIIKESFMCVVLFENMIYRSLSFGWKLKRCQAECTTSFTKLSWKLN